MTVDIYPAWAMAFFATACTSVMTFYRVGEGWVAVAAMREWVTQIGLLCLMLWRLRSFHGGGQQRRLSLSTVTTLAHMAHWLYIAFHTSDAGALLVQPVGWVLTGLFYMLSCRGLVYLVKEEGDDENVAKKLQ